MSFLFKISVIAMAMKSLLACSQWLPSFDPQTKFASLNPNHDRDAIERDSPEPYVLAGSQGPEAQHVLGPFFAAPDSHDSLRTDDNQPHQKTLALSDSDVLPLPDQTDQSEFTIPWTVHEVSKLECSVASNMHGSANLMLRSRRQCTVNCKVQRRRMSGDIGLKDRRARKKPIQ